MGALVTATLALTLIHPAFLLTPEPQDLPPADPSLGLTFDPWTMTLTWDCGQNSTSVKCGMTSRTRPVTIRPKGNQCRCTFSKAVLHGGAEFTVTAEVGRRRVTEKLTYANPGGPGTAAQNVSCLIYNADLMNCTWVKGSSAPDDVQYFLYIRDLGSGRTRSCMHYLGDPGPAAHHTGCHLQGASSFGPEIYVLVNGSSPDAGVQFYDTTVVLKTIEIYDPPANITVACNASLCAARWAAPRIRVFLSHRELQYQLGLHPQNTMQPGDHQLVDIAGGPSHIYVFPKPAPRAKHVARMRAADSRVLSWGPWSRDVEFGSEEWAPGRHLLLAVLVVLATVSGVLVSLVLVNRFAGGPVPRVRDKVTDTDAEIFWEKFAPDAGNGDRESVIRVDEEPGTRKPAAEA